MAINFPSTAGQPIDGTFTYVAAGITYSWNGESWNAAGGGATATDLTVFSVSNSSPSGGGSLNYNNTTGDFTFTPPDLSSYLTSIGNLTNHTDVNITTVQGNDVLVYNGSNLRWENLTPGAGSGLDSDLLDGQEGSYYTNAGNISTGILPTDRLSGTYNVDISGSASSISSINDAGDVTISSATDGQILQYNGSNWVNADSGGKRNTVSFTATNLDVDTPLNFSITTPNTYALLKIETSHSSWLTLYTDTTSRTADASRTETTDPLPGSGVIAEVITSSATTQLITPGVIGFSSSQNNTTYAKIVNKSGTQVNLQVVLTYVPLED